MTSKEMVLQYEIEKLKAKLNLCSNIIDGIDKNMLDLEARGNCNLKLIRDELRDLKDFMKENC